MLFNSISFLIFFPIVTLLYYAAPHPARCYVLLAASCIFYMAFVPVYILILFALILIDYGAALWIDNSQGKARKRGLILSIFATCLVLVIFKYFNFFNANIASLAHVLHWNYPVKMLDLMLPIGLSFHTFQSLSYVIEVYKQRQKPERNLGVYALYVMFYPQLVAGPIERPQHLLHQIKEQHYFNYAMVTDGLKLMAWGMFKKVVIADRLAVFVNTVYGNPQQYQGISLMEATVFFAFQIYCDFSGYSDIAIGSAQVMGFRLRTNFNRPYFSKSIAEFWKRWHISLSTWFKDYLYIPLGGNRCRPLRWYFNIGTTFLISGLWHGANWTYVTWGALNGFYLICGLMTREIRDKAIRFLGINRLTTTYQFAQVSMTFLLVCFAWIFFRAKNMSDAVFIATHIFSGVGPYGYHVLTHVRDLGQGGNILKPFILGQGIVEFVIAVASIGVLLCIQCIQRHGSVRMMLSAQPVGIRWTSYCLLLLAIWFFGCFGADKQFIYFQF